MVTATLSLAYSLSTSSMIFAGPLQKSIGFGMAAALVTAGLAALVTAFASGFRFAIASPTSTLAAALAVTVAALEPALQKIPEDHVLPTVFAVLASATIATGLTLIVLGQWRLGKIIRFIPFPVVAGFMGITGWLLAFGALRLTFGMPLVVENLPELISREKTTALAMTLSFAGLLFGLKRLSKTPMVMPSLLFGGVLTVNLAIWALNLSEGDQLPHHFMIGTGTHLSYDPPLSVYVVDKVDWLAMTSILPNILAVVFISVLTCLLTCTGLENDLDVDSDLDHELRVQGIANLVVAAAGGFIGLISVGTTRAARASGANGRTVGYFTGLVCLTALLSGISFINYVPRFLIGGLQFDVGIEVLWTWCFASRHRMPFSEWLLVIGIVAVAIWVGFMPAVLCGIAGGCVLFAMKVSRIDVVRSIYGLDQRSSTIVRSQRELEILAKYGARTKVIELSGFIFFGSAYQLLNTVHTIILEKPHCLIFDFTRVTGGDSSTTMVLVRLAKRLRREGIRLVLAGGSARTISLLRNADFIDATTKIVADRETALQLAETEILDKCLAQSEPAMTLGTWLTQALGSEAHAKKLIPLLVRADLPAGTYICRQGDPTENLIFIERGRVGVMITIDGKDCCARIFGPNTITGEQGFVLQMPRSASLKVETDATIWSLSRQTYETLLERQADIVVALMCDIIRLQSERLIFATRQAAALSK